MGVMTVSYLTIDGEIVCETRNGVTTDYLNDPQGNVVGLIDSTQTITAERTYWPFGEVSSQTGSWPTNFGYAGGWGGCTDQWGGIYQRARTEDPITAQWIALDPLWPDELAYAYVGNNPVTYIDPTGTQLLKQRPFPEPGTTIGHGCHEPPFLPPANPFQHPQPRPPWWQKPFFPPYQPPQGLKRTPRPARPQPSPEPPEFHDQCMAYCAARAKSIVRRYPEYPIGRWLACCTSYCDDAANANRTGAKFPKWDCDKTSRPAPSRWA